MRILAWPAFVNRRNNPYNWLLYTHIKKRGAQVDEFSLWHLLRGKYAIWHLHWPECLINFRHSFLASACAILFLHLLDAARAKGTRIVWTIHNLEAHDSRQPSLESWFWRRFTQRIDGYICMTGGTLNSVRARFPCLAHVPGFIIPHGHYRQVYKNRCDRKRARARLGISPKARVIVYFGQIRPYKRDVLNSGSALLALSFNRAILVPDLGAMGELQAQLGSNWVYTYKGELTEKILGAGLEWEGCSQRGTTAPLNVFEWDEIARLTLNAYWQVWSGRYYLSDRHDASIGLDTL